MALFQASSTIPTNAGESQGARFQHISSIVIGSANLAAFNSVVAVGWKSTPAMSFAVNGTQPNRLDTDMIVQSLPVVLRDGPFVVNPGTIPGRLAGSSADLQVSVGVGGITIGPDSSAVFVATLPLLGASGPIHLTSLTLSVTSEGAGGALGDRSAALWNWQTGSWAAVDVTSGQVDIRQPARFVDATGSIRIRVSAQSASLSLSDPNDGVSLGATGMVGP
jgi:hypothetical protein